MRLLLFFVLFQAVSMAQVRPRCSDACPVYIPPVPEMEVLKSTLMPGLDALSPHDNTYYFGPSNLTTFGGAFGGRCGWMGAQEHSDGSCVYEIRFYSVPTLTCSWRIRADGDPDTQIMLCRYEPRKGGTR